MAGQTIEYMSMISSLPHKIHRRSSLCLTKITLSNETKIKPSQIRMIKEQTSAD